MPCAFLTFGEVLWDGLPTGRQAGGAPFNVAAHLAGLGRRVALLSAVGEDRAGEALEEVVREKGVGTLFLTHNELPTGAVEVTLGADGDARYEITAPAAWDAISLPEEALAAAAQARALVYGSLAARSPHNREQLRRLLAVPGPRKCFDVNLRPPFDDLQVVQELARGADLLKLNEPEAARLAPAGSASPEQMVRRLAEATGAGSMCLTRGAAGAVLWHEGRVWHASAPAVTVCDTVGAGDALMAALVAGLAEGRGAQATLEHACRVGAYVASQPGATPALPAELRLLP